MSAPKVGDRVRVTYEGTYDRAFPSGGEMVHEIRSGDMFLLAPPDAKFEILRPPVKVGDVIETAGGIDALPLDTVVLNKYRTAIQKDSNGWFSASSHGDALSAFGVQLPATVIHLPDGAA
jgi:hypothetical protein